MDIIQKHHSDTLECILGKKKRYKWWKSYVKHEKGEWAIGVMPLLSVTS